MEQDNQPQPGQQMGRGMLTIGWIICLALLTWKFGDWESQKINPNQQLDSDTVDGRNEVVLQQNRWGQYLFTGKINGVAVNFLVDTGANDIAVPKELQQELGLIRGARGTASTANGYTTFWHTDIDSVEIGNIRLFDLEGSILDNMPGGYVLLGMTALTHLEIEQKNNTLILRQ